MSKGQEDSKVYQDDQFLNVYQDDEFFEKVKFLTNPYEQTNPNGLTAPQKPVNRCQAQAKLMDDALDIIKVVNEQQQAEIIRLVAARDPIMWHILCLNANINVKNSPPEMILKRFIMTLNIFRTKIDKEYHDIIRPKLWGKPLEKKYMEFEQFAEGSIEKEYIVLIKIALGFLFVIGFIYLMSKYT